MRKTNKLTVMPMLLAIGLVLPFITGQIPAIGVMLSPMHFPVIIGGFILGPGYGAILGAVTPLLRNVLFGIPKIPNAFFMAFELMTYGCVSGFMFFNVFKKDYSLPKIYLSLIVSMISGRIVYGIVKLISFRYLLNFGAYTFGIWLSDIFLLSIPGIVAQLILIPFLIKELNKRGIVK